MVDIETGEIFQVASIIYHGETPVYGIFRQTERGRSVAYMPQEDYIELKPTYKQDKTGVPIYEGDVVDVFHDGKLWYRGIVEYDNDLLRWHIRQTVPNPYEGREVEICHIEGDLVFDNTGIDDIEIIGSIYEGVEA